MYLPDATFINATVLDCNFHGTQLIRPKGLATSTWEGTNMSALWHEGLDFRDTQLRNCKLSPLTIAGVRGQGQIQFSGAIMSNCDLTGLDLRQMSFVGTTLTECNLSHSQLEDANFTDAVLDGTDLSSIDLRTTLLPSTRPLSAPGYPPTNFTRSTLTFAQLGHDWTNTNLSDVVMPDFATQTNLDGLLADSVVIAHTVNLPDITFSGKSLVNAQFNSATLKNVEFTGAKLENSSFAAIEQLNTRSDMTNVGFSFTKLSGADFTGAVITNSRFVATTMIGGTFTKAILSGERAELACDFTHAYLQDVEMTGGEFLNVTFSHATILGADQYKFAGCDMTGVNFSGAFLPEADFTKAILQGAIFDNACLVAADFSGADVTPYEEHSRSASLVDCCMQGVTFTETKLAGANLTNSAFAFSIGSLDTKFCNRNGELEPSHGWFPWNYANNSSTLDEAIPAAETILPNGLSYAANMAAGNSVKDMYSAPGAPHEWQPTSCKRRPD